VNDTNDTHYLTCATNNHSNSKNKKITLQGFKLQVTNVPKKHDRRECGSSAFVDRILSNHYQLTLILKPIKTPVSSHFIQFICKREKKRYYNISILKFRYKLKDPILAVCSKNVPIPSSVI